MKNFKYVDGILTNEKLIGTIGMYLKRVEDLANEWDAESLWFRGVSDAEFNLMPSIYRKSLWEYNPMVADDMSAYFGRMYKAYYKNDLDKSEISEYMLMQHYGLPTRLLDWTQSAITALFFAIENIMWESPTVWIIDPFELNEKFNKGYNIPIISDDEDIIKTYMNDSSKELPNLPIAFYPTFIDERIAAQKSCFTLHGKIRQPLEFLMKKYKVKRFAKLVFNSSKTYDIRIRLFEIGQLSYTNFFPDMGGLVKEIKSMYGLFG